MKISILTAFPELYEQFLATSLLSKAQQAGLVDIATKSFFSFVAPKERIDAPTFGHGAGMLIKPIVVDRAISAIEEKSSKAYKVFFSPHGKKLDQQDLQQLFERIAQSGNHLMLVCGRYEGMDARVEQHYADEIISIGDYVLMGGDLPAMVLMEGLLRYLPGVVGKQESVERESFSGPFVDHPEYTEPVVWHDKEVPEVIRSGNHRLMSEWRAEQAAKRTVIGHFDWLRSQHLSPHDNKLARSVLPRHYVALMHGDVLIGDGIPGTTSVTSIDIHDIARSSKTYGIERFFMVTPLVDQQKIVQKLTDFWHSESGGAYNQSRQDAIKHVNLQASLDEVIASVRDQEGQEPLLIATSARTESHNNFISFFDHERVWKLGRPVIFVFGTGKGLTKELLARTDFLLLPIHGFSQFNHLSVRSAVAIVLDRWLGINERHPA